MVIDNAPDVRLRGRVTLRVLNPDGSVADERTESNVLCINGLSTLVQAIIWSAAQDQAADMGNPDGMNVSLFPIFGAVGSAVVTPVDTDTQLGTELSRAIISSFATQAASHNVPAQLTMQFFFGTTGTWSVTEAGIFVSPNSTDTVNTGALLNHVAFSPAVAKSNVQTLVLSVTITLGN